MNKVLGFAAVVIMIGAMGYVIVSEQHTSTAVEAEKQTTEKVQTTTSSSNEKKTSTSTKKTKNNLPDVKAEDWELILVGPDHKLDQEIDEATQLTALDNWYMIDKRIKANY